MVILVHQLLDGPSTYVRGTCTPRANKSQSMSSTNFLRCDDIVPEHASNFKEEIIQLAVLHDACQLSENASDAELHTRTIRSVRDWTKLEKGRSLLDSFNVADINNSSVFTMFSLLHTLKTFCSESEGRAVDPKAYTRVWDVFKMGLVEEAATSCRFVASCRDSSGASRIHPSSPSYPTSNTVPAGVVCMFTT